MLNVIAVDGPAASGKGTLARRLAAHLGYEYLDTGKLYRAVGKAVVDEGYEPDDINSDNEVKAFAVKACGEIDPKTLANPILGTEVVGRAASIISAVPEVRQALLDYQRHFATQGKGAILDGRDIGTVICPDAKIKLFVTADIATRARRRHKELQKQNDAIIYEAVLQDLEARDARDARRQAAPMKVADDAITIDTTTMTMDEVFANVVEIVEAST